MTRSKIFIAFAAFGFLSAPAFADTANFTFGGPKGQSIKMTVQMGDGKTRTCDMVSSAKAIGPKGLQLPDSRRRRRQYRKEGRATIATVAAALPANRIASAFLSR